MQNSQWRHLDFDVYREDGNMSDQFTKQKHLCSGRT